MRQITSYETNNIDTLNDALVHLRTLELEQYNLEVARKLVHDHEYEERTMTPSLIAENALLRANLTVNKNLKVYNDDQSFREMVRNQGLEPQNVALTVTKTTQDNFIYQTNLTNGRLTAHAAQTLAHNTRLNAEKKELWLSLESNERDEWYWHENAIAVEAQNPLETILKEYNEEQQGLHRSYISDLTKRNELLAATVPGLTTDRDAQEAEKLLDTILFEDWSLQAAAEEEHVVKLQKSKAALEKLIMQYQRANNDLRTYNTHLVADITELTAERNAMRVNYEEMTNERNAAQIQADHWEVMNRDVEQKAKDANLAAIEWSISAEFRTNHAGVCNTRNTALTLAKTGLETSNLNLRNTCY